MRKSLANHSCPVARAADQIGDGWIMLIMWATFNGVHRFDDLQKELGVARNILSDRLRRMVENDLLEKTPVQEGARRLEYKPTAKSKALHDIMMHIQDWSQNWCPVEKESNTPHTDNMDTHFATDTTNRCHGNNKRRISA